MNSNIFIDGDLSLNGGLEVYNGKVGIGKTPDTLYNLDIIGAINCTDGVFVNNSSLAAGTGEPIVAKGMAVQIKHTDYKEKVQKTSAGWSAIDARTDGNGFVVKITPKSIQSKVLVSTVVHIGQDGAGDARWWGARLHRKIGNGAFLEVAGANGEDDQTTINSNAATVSNDPSRGMWVWFANNQGMLNSDGASSFLIGNATASYLDSPGTTEEVTYTIFWASQISGNYTRTIYLNRSHEHSDSNRAATSSSLTATEIWDDSTPYNPTDSAIMIDTGTNYVGIGTTNPTSRLTIMSAASENGDSDEFAFLSQYNTAEDRVGYVQKIGFYGKEEYSNTSKLAASIECLYGDNSHIPT